MGEGQPSKISLKPTGATGKRKNKKIPEITRTIGFEKMLIYYIDERVFSKFENRFGMITGRNI